MGFRGSPVRIRPSRLEAVEASDQRVNYLGPTGCLEVSEDISHRLIFVESLPGVPLVDRARDAGAVEETVEAVPIPEAGAGKTDHLFLDIESDPLAQCSLSFQPFVPKARQAKGNQVGTSQRRKSPTGAAKLLLHFGESLPALKGQRRGATSWTPQNKQTPPEHPKP